MTVVGGIQSFLCIAVVVTAGVLHPIAHYKLKSYVRRAHPRVWRRFEYPSDSLSVRPEHERAAAIADIGFGEFFATGQFKKLNDPQLNALWRRRTKTRWAAVLALALAVLIAMVFRAAPDFSWLMG